MKFTDELENNVVVFHLAGKIMGQPEEMTRFRGRVHEYLELNKNQFVLDLKKVEWMNSIGLGLLTSTLASVKRGDGRMVLANIGSIENILAMTRLITVFDHYDSVDDAAASFK
jgi:anti-sigma B factor antagonist